MHIPVVHKNKTSALNLDCGMCYWHLGASRLDFYEYALYCHPDIDREGVFACEPCWTVSWDTMKYKEHLAQHGASTIGWE